MTVSPVDKYVEVYNDLTEKLKLITDLHESYYEVDPENTTWSDVGDLGRIRSKIEDILHQLGYN